MSGATDIGKTEASYTLPVTKNGLSQAQKQIIIITSFHLLLIVGILFVLHHLSLAPTDSFIALYSFLAFFALLATSWTVFVERRSITYLGITHRNLGKSLAINTILALTIYTSMGSTGSIERIAPYIPLALISALFEVVYIYGWLQNKLREITGFTVSLLLTAVLYALYHVGYYGLTPEGLDVFSLSFGLYVIVGIANASIFRYTGSAFSLWPLSLGLGTAFDYLRIGLPFPEQSLPMLLILFLFLLAIVVITLVSVQKSRNAQSTSGPSQIETGQFSIKDQTKIDLKFNYNRFIKTSVFIFPLFLMGLVIRFVINDPVEGVELLPPVMAQSFYLERSVMNEITLKMGFAIYLLIPLFCLIMWHDIAIKDRRVFGILSQHGVVPGQVAKAGVISKAVLTVLAVLAFIVIAFPFTLLLSHYHGYTPTSNDLLRYCLVAFAAIVYTLLNFFVVCIISYATRHNLWVWFVGLVTYIFIYNWWMIYPLFSQYEAVGLPNTNDPAAIIGWMSSLWQRVTPLYAFVPHYNYYISLTVTYLRNVFDSVWFVPSMSSLISYTFSFFILTLAYAQESVGYLPQYRISR